MRARRVEVTHADIRLVFEDAAVFYDNIPDLDTALVVVGRGRVAFTPGDANEKHQLELQYKRDRIEDQIESLFIRCSPSFFGSRVRIDVDEGGAAVSAAERDKAASVFSRNYPRSFTIESSIDGSRLSFMPQGDEVGLELQGPQGRGDGLHLLPVRRRRGQSLRSRQGTGRLPLHAGRPVGPAAPEDGPHVRGEVRRHGLLARPELFPLEHLPLGPGPHRGRSPGRSPRDPQVPLQSRLRDPQDHGRPGAGAVLYPGPRPPDALRPLRRAARRTESRPRSRCSIGDR
ncbi:MAG: hypothetical protein MZV64_32720 [Ignavibacteriales bacterium]|nr:hypothetical protein [Ignavibacteriales bacterium]